MGAAIRSSATAATIGILPPVASLAKVVASSASSSAIIARMCSPPSFHHECAMSHRRDIETLAIVLPSQSCLILRRILEHRRPCAAVADEVSDVLTKGKRADLLPLG